MRLIVCGLMLVFLTACGKTGQAPSTVAPAVAVESPASVPTGFYPPSATVAAELPTATPASERKEKKRKNLELMAAELNFKHEIKESDSSVAIAKKYLDFLGKKYHTDPDMLLAKCFYVSQEIEKNGHDVSLFDIFEAAKIIRSGSTKKLTQDDLIKTLAAYALQRDLENHVDSMANLRKFFSYVEN
jgi:hypothetical protein